MAVEPAEKFFVPFQGVSKFFAAVTAIGSQHIDIQLSFRNVDTNKVEFLFHSETNLVNADYRRKTGP